MRAVEDLVDDRVFLCEWRRQPLGPETQRATQIALTIVAAQPLAREFKGPQSLAACVFTVAQR